MSKYKATLPAEKFLSKVDKQPTDCWLWTGAKDQLGYGLVYVSGTGSKSEKAHRYSVRVLKGEDIDGLVVRHLCDTPSCVNPDHLITGSQADNMNDMVERGRHAMSNKTHCPKGHPYNDLNTYTDPQGRRNCRQCKREGANWKGGIARQNRTHCPQGHPYDESNTYISPQGARGCKECRRVRSKLQKEELRKDRTRQ